MGKKKRTEKEERTEKPEEKKNRGYYFRQYLAENAVIFLCELLIILLVGIIGSILLEGRIIWLVPAMGACAYVVGELRYMQDFVKRRLENDAERKKQLREKSDAEEEEELNEWDDYEGEEDSELNSALLKRIQDLLDSADQNLAGGNSEGTDYLQIDTLEEIIYPTQPIFRKEFQTAGAVKTESPKQVLPATPVPADKPEATAEVGKPAQTEKTEPAAESEPVKRTEAPVPPKPEAEELTKQAEDEQIKNLFTARKKNDSAKDGKSRAEQSDTVAPEDENVEDIMEAVKASMAAKITGGEADGEDGGTTVVADVEEDVTTLLTATQTPPEQTPGTEKAESNVSAEAAVSPESEAKTAAKADADTAYETAAEDAQTAKTKTVKKPSRKGTVKAGTKEGKKASAKSSKAAARSETQAATKAQEEEDDDMVVSLAEDDYIGTEQTQKAPAEPEAPVQIEVSLENQPGN